MLNYSFFSTQTSLWRRHTLIKHVRSCFFSQGKDGTASDCIMKNKSHARVLYRSRSIDSSRTNRTNPKISRAKLVKVYLVAYIDNVMLAERRIVTDALEQTTRRNEIVMKKAIYLHPGDHGKRRDCAQRLYRSQRK